MIPEFNKSNLAEIRQLLSTPKKVCIITHQKPDGDALGSSLGLYHVLEQLGHHVNIVSPSDFPEFLAWMPESSKVIDFVRYPAVATDLLKNADLIFCLDFNEPHRVEKAREALMGSLAVRILIDHHIKPADFCNYTFSYPEACATAELVYHFIIQLGFRSQLNKQVAECLYAGIMTDSGSFRFASMSADTHNIIAELMRAGAVNYLIHEQIYDNFSTNRMKFLGYCLSEKMEIISDLRTAYFAITQEELQRFNHRPGDTEGIVNYGLSIKGIILSAFFCEKDDFVKISFRSKDLFSVKDLAAIHFNGGGHRNAAGGKSSATLDLTVEYFLKILPSYKDALLVCP